MKYPLPYMTINEEECKHIIRPIVNFGLTKGGISSTLHAVVRYGPQSLRGIRLFDPFMIQGSVLIDFLIEHYWKSIPSIPLVQDNLST